MADTTKRIIWQLIGETRGMENLNRQTKTAEINMGKLALRAAAVIPTWVLLRSTILALPRALASATKEWIALEAEMARVATVTRGTTKDVEVLEDVIVDFAASSKASFKDTASAMYALGSAGLTVTQQMAGLEHVMNTAIGTGGDVEQTAKLMAGAFNVFGKSLEGANTTAEKFKKIGDIISYTYSTQQVELSELATALGYVASVGSLVEIKFEELVATIGVLNTGMLKGSKSGTSLVNAFIQLANKSERLGALGIQVNADEPLNFKRVLEDLYDLYGDSALSLKSLQNLMRTFGIRGGRAVGLLLNNFEFFNETLVKTAGNAEDFARIMRRIQEDTIPGVASKIKNQFTAIWKDILDGFAPEFKKTLDKISQALDEFRAKQKAKGILGQKTLADGVRVGAPAAAQGVGAFLLGRGIPGQLRFREAGQLAQQQADAANRGFHLQRQGLGAKELAKADPAASQALGQVPRSRLSQTNRAFTQREFFGASRNQINAQMGAVKRFGSTLLGVGKFAVLGYAGLKLVQGALNTLAPDSEITRDLNEFIGLVEKYFVKFILKVAEIVKDFAIYIGILSTKGKEFKALLDEDLANIGKFFKSLVAPITALANILAGKDIASNFVALQKGIVEASEGAAEREKKAFRNKVDFVTGVGEEVDPTKKILREERAARDASERALIEFVKSNQTLINKARTGQEGGKLLPDAIKEAFAKEEAARIESAAGLAPLEAQLNKLESTLAKVGEDDPGRSEAERVFAESTLKVWQQIETNLEGLNKKGFFGEEEGALGRAKKTFGAEGYLDVEGEGKQKERDITLGIILNRFLTQQAAAGIQTPAPGGGGREANTRVFRNKLADIRAEAEIQQLQLFDFDADTIALEELRAKLASFNALWGKQLADKKLVLTVDDLLLDNQEKLVKIIEIIPGVEADILELRKKSVDVLTEQQKVIKETGSYVKGAFTDAFQSIFDTQGDISFSELATNFGSAMREAWSGQFSEIFGEALTNISGLDSIFGGWMDVFGKAFKKTTNPISKAHLQGIEAGLPLIVQAHQDGMNGTTSTTDNSPRGMLNKVLNNTLGASSPIGKFLKMPVGGGNYQPQLTKGSLFANGVVPDNSVGGIVQRALGSDFTGASSLAGGGITAALARGRASGGAGPIGVPAGGLLSVAGNTIASTWGGSQAGGLIAGGLTGAGALASGLAGLGASAAAGAAAAGGFAAGTTGAAVAAGGLGGMLAGSAAFLGPLGLALGIGGMLWSMFNPPEPPAWKKEESREQTMQIASRIDTTNASLEWVNRNLVEMRQELTYIMRESFYFSEKSEAERFAIDAQRGVLGG